MSKKTNDLTILNFFNEQIIKLIKNNQETYFDNLCELFDSHFKTDLSSSAINKHLSKNFVLLTYSFILGTEKTNYQYANNDNIKLTNTKRVYVSRDAMNQLLLKHEELRNIENFLFSLSPSYSECHYIKLHYKKNIEKTYYIIKLKIYNLGLDNELLNLFQQCFFNMSGSLENLNGFQPIDILKGKDSLILVFDKKSNRKKFRKLLHQKPPANRNGLDKAFYYFPKSPSHYVGNITNFHTKNYSEEMRENFYNTVVSYYKSLQSTDSTIEQNKPEDY